MFKAVKKGLLGIIMGLTLSALGLVLAGCGGKAYLFCKPEITYSPKKGFYNCKSEKLIVVAEEECGARNLITPYNESSQSTVSFLRYEF